MKQVNVIAICLGLVSLNAFASDSAGCVTCSAHNDERHAASHTYSILRGGQKMSAYHRSDDRVLKGFVTPVMLHVGPDNDAHKERLIKRRAKL